MEEGKIVIPMVFLGLAERKSQTKRTVYWLARMAIGEDGEIANFYVGDLGLKKEIGHVKQYTQVDGVFELRVYNGKAELSLVGVIEKKVA